MNTTSLIINDNGSQVWLLNGHRHREDGPAVIYADGTQFWYINNKLHREDGPAVIYSSGTQFWYLNGERHREDGPAAIWALGTMRWYLNGKLYFNKKKYQEDANLSDEDMNVLLLKYNWESKYQINILYETK